MTNTQSSNEVVLKVDTLGRVRTPRDKQEAIVSAYRGSGMTGQQFATYSVLTADPECVDGIQFFRALANSSIWCVTGW